MTAATWTTVHVRIPGDRASVVAALFQCGAEGVQEIGDGIVTHLRDPDVGELRRAIERADREATLVVTPTPDIDWSEAWRGRISAHHLGRLTVTPPWLAENYPAAARIVIDPGMAFGTGEHETTRGMIRLLDGQVARGDVVADLGTGSGVLAIAAAKLGAARVAAVEIDADAIGNAEENVRRNDVADRVRIIEGDALVLLPLLAPVRIVVANIISSVLRELLPAIGAALDAGGCAVLGGMLAEERQDMRRAFSNAGFAEVRSDEEGAWWGVVIAQR